MRFIDWLADNFGGIFILLCILLVFNVLLEGSSKYKQEKMEFEINCNKSGGVVLEHKSRGWPELQCVNPDYLIDLKGDL